MKRTAGNKVFDAIVYLFIILACITIFPMMQVLTISLSPVEIVNRYGLHLFHLKYPGTDT